MINCVRIIGSVRQTVLAGFVAFVGAQDTILLTFLLEHRLFLGTVNHGLLQ